MDVSRVDDDADAQLPLRPAGAREAGVVVGQETVESGDGAVEQERFGGLLDWADERQESVTTVDVPVAMAFADSRRAQGCIK